MRYVVAGVVLLAAMVIAVISLYIPLDSMTEGEEDGGMTPIREGRSPAAAIKACVVSASWAHRGMILLSSLLCAAVAWISVGLSPVFWGYGRWCIVVLMLLAAMIVDQRSHQIPNSIVLSAYIGGAVLLGLEFLFQSETAGKTLLSGVIGAACCVVLFYVMSRMTKEGIGMGDVKLISAMGWLLGFVSTIIAILFALVICTLAAVVLLLAKKKSKNDCIPFGPFLFFGYVIMMLLYCL